MNTQISENLIRQEPLRWREHHFNYSPYFYESSKAPSPVYKSNLGALFAADCMQVLPFIKAEMVDTVFADPPFNLGKKYGKNTDDLRKEEEYLSWCKNWLAECVRVLKPGGAFFLYNLPKWNILLGYHLFGLGMQFRHWIALEISASLPIQGRLHPSHYSLLYFTKGKPRTFRRIRTPIEICRHCNREIKDYGGHRHAMNPRGVNLKDVWTDIPPVRHWKFKSKNRKANALSTKILDRVVEMSTVTGDLILDPFGGSGTTYVVSERKRRKWLGIEIDFAGDIVSRLEDGEIHAHRNTDHVED
jgi:site-specific DNA-methyltransferase (adenine-specific)